MILESTDIAGAMRYRKKQREFLKGGRPEFVNQYMYGSGGPAYDPDDAYCTLSLEGEGTNGSTAILDSKDRAWANVNGATLSNAVTPPYDTTSMLFNGSTQYLMAAPKDAGLNLTGDFIVSTYVYVTAMASGRIAPIIAQYGNTTTDKGFLFGIQNSAGTIQLFLFHSPDGTSAATLTIAVTFTGFALNTSYFISYSRSGNNFRFFVNGTQMGATQTMSTAPFNHPTQPYTVGMAYAAAFSDRFFPGRIKGLRVYKGIAQTANYTVPLPLLPVTYTDPNMTFTKSILRMNNIGTPTTLSDDKGITWTAGGAAQQTANYPKFGAGGLDVPASGFSGIWTAIANVAPGAGDFSFETYLRQYQTAQVSSRVMQLGDGDIYGGISLSINDGVSAQRMQLHSSINGSSWAYASPVLFNIVIGTYYHLHVGRIGTTLLMHLNGILLASPTVSGTLNAPGGGRFILGGNISTGASRSVGSTFDSFRATVGKCRFPAATFNLPDREHALV